MIVFGCSCGKTLRTKDEAAGKKTKCPGCGAVLTIPGASEPAPAGAGDGHAGEGHWPTVELHAATASVATATARSSAAAATPGGDPPSAVAIKIDSLPAGPDQPLDGVRAADRPRPADGTLQYKVLSGKDQAATGKFNPLRLEEVLNDHARQGWAVRSAATITIAGHGGSHDELIVILER
jgi:hypothetical protein